MSAPVAEHLIANPCPEKEALIEQIRTLVTDLTELYNAEADASLKNDLNSVQDCQATIALFRQFKADLIGRYRQHIEAHGCDC